MLALMQLYWLNVRIQIKQNEAFCSGNSRDVKSFVFCIHSAESNSYLMLHDQTGYRKYLTSTERRLFMEIASRAENDVQAFALTLARTGARISEILEVRPCRIDFATQCIIIRTLKRRRPDVYRSIPVPSELLELLDATYSVRTWQRDSILSQQRIWPWCRTTAWAKIKSIMAEANITGPTAMPKALRHGFGVESTAEAAIPLNIVQKWLGHARIETTAIYANAVGKEERLLASRLW